MDGRVRADETTSLNGSGEGGNGYYGGVTKETSMYDIADSTPLMGKDTDAESTREAAAESLEKAKPIDLKAIKALLLDYVGTMILLVVVGVLLAVAGTLAWAPMGWQAWVTICITVLTLAVLLKDQLPPHYVMVVSMTLLMAMRIVTEEEAVAGFSNTGVLTIAVLFVVAKAIENNRALDPIVKYVLRKPTRLWVAQFRLMVPVAAFSAFINNTPLVAMYIPIVSAWARDCKLPASRLMIPLSYAAVLGGTCTIIGTSTNLIIKGLLEDASGDQLTLGFFDVGAVGVPLFFVSMLYVMVASPYLLPDRTQAMDKYLSNPREYTAALRVMPRTELVGMTIEQAGLRNLDFVFLFQVGRGDDIIVAPGGDFVLQADDVLFFSGVITSMQQVYDNPSLTPATNQVAKVAGRLRNRCLVEVVVAPSSPLVGQTVKAARFRTKYNAAIIAIHRRNQRVDKPLGDIVLQAGDTLLCEAHKEFVRYHRMDQDFSLVNLLGGHGVYKKQRLWKTITVVLLTATMIALNSADQLDLLTGSLLVCCVFLALRIVKFDEAAEAINGELIVLIAAAFCLGTALEKSGAAKTIAEWLILVLEPLGPPALLAGIYLITTVLTELISNAATVTLIFPIAWQMVVDGPLNYKAMCYTLMMAGSSSFCTPIGYQTNLMVMVPGGYVFSDYIKFGLPLNALAMVVTVTLCTVIWQIPHDNMNVPTPTPFNVTL